MVLYVAHMALVLAEDGEEYGEEDEDGGEEVQDEKDGVGVATRVVHDRLVRRRLRVRVGLG